MRLDLSLSLFHGAINRAGEDAALIGFERPKQVGLLAAIALVPFDGITGSEQTMIGINGFHFTTSTLARAARASTANVLAYTSKDSPVSRSSCKAASASMLLNSS